MHYLIKCLVLMLCFSAQLVHSAPINGATPNTMIEDFVKTCTLQFPLFESVNDKISRLNIAGNVSRGLRLVEFQQQQSDKVLVSSFIFDAPLLKLASAFDEIKIPDFTEANRPAYYLKLGFVINHDDTVNNTQSMLQCFDYRQAR